MLRAPSAALEAQGAAPKTRWVERLVLPIDKVDWRDIISKYLVGEEPEDASDTGPETTEWLTTSCTKGASAPPSYGVYPAKRDNPS